jgi:hypothetical protein
MTDEETKEAIRTHYRLALDNMRAIRELTSGGELFGSAVHDAVVASLQASAVALHMDALLRITDHTWADRMAGDLDSTGLLVPLGTGARTAAIESLKATAAMLKARPPEEMNADWADCMVDGLAVVGLLRAP